MCYTPLVKIKMQETNPKRDVSSCMNSLYCIHISSQVALLRESHLTFSASQAREHHLGSHLHGAEEGRVWRLCWKFRACDAGISEMPPCFKPRALLLSVCPSDSTEQLSVSSILGLHAGSTGKSAAQRCSGSTPSCTEPSPWRPAAPGSPPTPRAPRLSLQCRRVLWH